MFFSKKKLLISLLFLLLHASCSPLPRKINVKKEVPSKKIQKVSEPPVAITSSEEKEEEKIKEVKKREKKKEFKYGDVEFDVHTEILPNGLKVLLVHNGRMDIAAYYTFYKVGSRYEKEGMTGATHFLEHLMFKGSKKFGSGQFDKLLELNGGSTNAYTNLDSTVYYQQIPSKALPLMIEMEADRMQNLIIENKSFESERKVVLEEKALRYNSNPKNRLFLAMMEEMYEGTPYEIPVIGLTKDIKGVTREQIVQYYQEFYNPKNAILVIVGKFDQDEIIKLIKKNYGKLTTPDNSLVVKKVDNEIYKLKGKLGRKIKIHGNSTNPYFLIAFKGTSLKSQDRYRFDLMSAILGSGESSYYYHRYITDKKPVLSYVFASHYSLEKNGLLFIGGELLKNASLNRFYYDFQANLKYVCKKAITERSLQKAKNQFLVDFYSNLNRNQGVAHYLGLQEFYFNDYKNFKKEIKAINSVTLNQVQDLCTKTMIKKNYNIFTVWDKYKNKKGIL